MFSVKSEIVITGVGMNSLCNFTKYYSCEKSLNVNFKFHTMFGVFGEVCKRKGDGICSRFVLH